MVGEVDRESLVTTAGAVPGDDVILTKGVAVEATSILAREKASVIRERHGEAFLERCRNYLRDPGIGVLREARVCCGAARVHCMHDPTEGGLAAGVHEIVRAAGVGMRIEADAIPILPEVQVLCEDFGLDPLGAIASGSLLVTLDPVDQPRVLRALEAAGIRAGRIGTVTAPDDGVKLIMGGEERDMPLYVRDEITKIF